MKLHCYLPGHMINGIVILLYIFETIIQVGKRYHLFIVSNVYDTLSQCTKQTTAIIPDLCQTLASYIKWF